MGKSRCCSNCKFFHERTAEDGSIHDEECRVNPPQMHPEIVLQMLKERKVHGDYISELMQVGVYPRISDQESNWCGSYVDNGDLAIQDILDPDSHY